MMHKKEIPIHDFAADNDESIPFKFISLGTMTDYDFSQPHRHNYYEIFFFSKGGGRHLIDFDEYEIKDRSIHFVSPGQVHLVRRALSSYGSIILFSRDFFYSGTDTQQKLFNFPFLNNSPYPIFNTSPEEYIVFESILQQIQNENKEDRDVFRELMHSYLKVVLLKCLQLFNQDNTNDKMLHSSAFHSFREMVEKEYRAHRQPSYYASLLHIPEKRLNELCKENCGKNVSDYIRERVMLEARRLLSNTGYSIKEISAFLGFDDPSYFNRFFKSNYGDTAGNFRKSGK